MNHLPTAPQLVMVEDDTRLAQLTETFLSENGFCVTSFLRGDQALDYLSSGCQPDLILLDWMLPGVSGVDVCKTIRQWYSGPIMLFTAKSSDFDQVVALELGADDYLIKPIEPHVLLARIKALLRRSHYFNPATETKTCDESLQLSFGKLLIDSHAQSVAFDQQAVNLTTREFQLLWLLASQAGHIVSRDVIMNDIRGLDYDGLDRSIDVRISKLRKKLGDSSEQPQRIKTVWGKGYLFVPSAWD